MIKIDEIEQASRAHAAAKGALEQMARRIAKLRTGTEPAIEFRMHSHARGLAGKVHEHDPDEDVSVLYPDDMEIVTVNLFHQRWGQDMDVPFPADYLDGTDGYVARETAAIAERAAAKERAEAEQAETDAAEALAERRRTYERLRLEFEGDPAEVARRTRMIDLARETLAGHPDGDAPSDLVLAWLANRAELHAGAVLAIAGEA